MTSPPPEVRHRGTMSSSYEQPWISLLQEFLVFPSGLIRPKVLPLHFNLGNIPLPQRHFSPV